MKNKKISPKTTFAELLAEIPESANVLMEAGMHCFGCPMSQMETIEQGAMAHGMSKKEINELMIKIEEIRGERKSSSLREI